tara:strand:- start:144 stop:455 length:312 start_codon:yes stop_codon:yes gene_type:complete
MSIKNILNIQNLKNEGWIDIRSFIITFTIYALICIWSANSIQSKDQELNILTNKIQKLKVKLVLNKQKLLDKKRRSKVIENASLFGFFPSEDPVKTIKVNYEN